MVNIPASSLNAALQHLFFKKAIASGSGETEQDPSWLVSCLVDDQGTEIGGANPFPVLPKPPGSLFAGQTATVTPGVPEPLSASSQALVSGVDIVAGDNGGDVFVGPAGVTASTGRRLPPNSSMFIAIDDINKVFIVAGTAAYSVSWSAT